ncbi:hypothetical protein CAPTEDRAFT_166920 [Capitella teleta]|uniref:Major facilitator superfamily (MFS) profile domain-containing protein n=1 Tax=Capitella teleta TaxID=283909 RepID=R7UB65_CAPTE|nr:hypothetical protein CAPTEDRAFT_166920 [Capitella teleta]|eukprot:ELU03605.1 hypothetical protein CAPTEDRAFT_166920 [Capitella teleta]
MGLNKSSTLHISTVIYIVGFLDLFAVSLIIPLLASHARSLGASPTVTGLLGSVYGGIQLFSSPLVGHWSDLSGRRYVLMLCLLLSASGYAMLTCASTLLLLFLARLPPGLFKHTQNLSRSFLAEASPNVDHARALGRYNAVSSVGFIVGPIIGGHLAESANGLAWTASLTTACFITCTGIVWLLVPEPSNQVQQQHKPAESDSLLSPLSFIGRIEWSHLWDVFLVRFLLGCAVLVSRNNFTMLLEYKYDASPSTVGYVISYGSVVSTVGGWYVGSIAKFYQDDMRLLMHAAIAQTVGLVAVGLAPSLGVLILCTTPLSISSAVARVCSTNITITRATGAEIGALLGLGASIMSISRMLAPFFGGVAQEVSASGSTYLGAMFAAAATLLLIFMPSHKHKTL